MDSCLHIVNPKSFPRSSTNDRIGDPNDRFEQNTDTRTPRMISTNEIIPISMQSIEEDESHLQMQPLEEEEELLQPKLRMQPIKEEEELLQPKHIGSKGSDLDSVSSQLKKSGIEGDPLTNSSNQFMSNAFGADFSEVKVHTGTDSVRMNQELGAKAFTYGTSIYFNQGQYNPSSLAGKHLLAHELTHVLQQNGPEIQRVPMPGESTVANLETYAAGTRQRILYDTGFNMRSGLSAYFGPGIVMAVRSGFNVTYVVRGFPVDEGWVADPLKALALYSFNLNDTAADPAMTNRTTVQHLDLSGQTDPDDATVSGPDAIIRFTSTQFDATGTGAARTQNVQLLIEKLSDFTATAASTETAEERRRRFETTYRITNAVPIRHDPLGDPIEAMSDSQFDVVLEALDHVPAPLLSRVTGIPIHRSLDARGADGEVAEYSQSRPAGSTTWNRRITVFREFFRMNAEQHAFTMIHEIEHALDYRPKEDPGDPGGPSISAATGRGSFRKAVRDDGGLARGVSTYRATATDHDEYFAEAFAMYQSQPDTLRALRPHVFAYFNTTFPSSP